ncbi:MAG: DEAD/DEAH box helicase family protein [Candidatus Thermoplasmatota archaeon]|nr:DEAD/DEAH box helicase family protein [Candidatus Thermoplasmatota archaeon]MCL5665339.1 DEAD/DEAH box helicase family protein [Candidatus Thermoplasmatota archaeon]
MTDYYVSGLAPRKYQINLFNEAKENNVLVVLPTGMGKTLIAAMVASYVLHENYGKVLMLAPTKPLVDQHEKTMKSLLSLKQSEIFSLTGDIPAEDRMERWVLGKVLISTPQVAWNDIKHGILDISKFGLVIFDEAHRAVGNYAYVGVSKAFREHRKKLILGLTASPGADKQRFSDVTEVLGIDKVIIKNEEDEDVKPYVNKINITETKIELPIELRPLISILKSILSEIHEYLYKSRLFPMKNPPRKLIAQQIKSVSARAIKGEKRLFSLIPYMTAAVRLDYALEYLETQGFEIFDDYISRILGSEEKTMKRTAQIIGKNERFPELIDEIERLREKPVSNSKMAMTLRICEDILSRKKGRNIIVFTHFRKTSQMLADYLNSNSEIIRAVRFVGQSSREGDRGLNRKEQEDIMTKFRSGEFNVLVATSVAEEGIDVPSTDAVIFYEPVPSDIRSIQRRGRTGRLSEGEVHILTYAGTRDIGYLFTGKKKESAMKKNIKGFVKKKKKVTLDDY